MPVYVRGKTEFSTYNDKHQTRFTPNQISLCKPIDFDAEDFNVIGNFEQVIIYMGLDKNEKGTSIVSAKIVTYNSIEETEFIIENPKLKKNLKTLNPYTAIKVFGNICVERDVEQVEDDGWGTPNPMNRVNNPTTIRLEIIGAEKESIDTDLYSEKIIDEAIAKMNSDKKASKDFGDSDDDWGSIPSKRNDNNDIDEEW